MFVTRVLFNYSYEFKKRYDTRSDSQLITSVINVSHQTSVQLLWWFRELIPHSEIRRTLQRKWIILITVVFSYADDSRKLLYIFTFTAIYIGSACLLAYSRSAFLMISRDYRTHWDSKQIAKEMNNWKKCFLELFWWIQHVTRQIGFHAILHTKWTILTRVQYSHSDYLEKISHTLRFIAYFVRTEWFSTHLQSLFWSFQEIIAHIEFHSTLHQTRMILNTVVFDILLISTNYPTHRDP